MAGAEVAGEGFDVNGGVIRDGHALVYNGKT
jgi:endonuclease YncB( thermonuclease family)